MQKAIFLDRDGVINSDEGHYYIYRIEDFVINPGIIPSLRRFCDKGYLLFVVTNQGGIAKGIYSSEDVDRLHKHLTTVLEQEGICLTQIYYCPHHHTVAPCRCRKPSPYFIKKAIQDYDLNPEECYMIGDSTRDIEAAEGAGVKGILIKANENISTYCDQIINCEI